MPGTAQRHADDGAGQIADAAARLRPQTLLMAHFGTTLTTDAPAQLVLEHLADIVTFADWDPGVTSAALTAGESGQVGARYLLTVPFGPRRIPLEYVVVDRADPQDGGPGRVVLVAETGSFTSHDTITVTPTEGGSQVQYDASLAAEQGTRTE